MKGDQNSIRYRVWTVIPEYSGKRSVQLEWFTREEDSAPTRMQFFLKDELLQLQDAILPLHWEFRCKQLKGESDLPQVNPMERCLESRLRDPQSEKGGCKPASEFMEEVDVNVDELISVADSFGEKLWVRFVLS